MIFAHRGNIDGPTSVYYENSETAILECIEKGFGVEIDIWVKNKKFYLGHDESFLQETDLGFLQDNMDWLLIHCKNKRAVKFFSNSDGYFHWFTHEQDEFAFTNEAHIICYGTKPPKLKNPSTCIIMLPERFSIEVPKGYSVCTDYPEKYVV